MAITLTEAEKLDVSKILGVTYIEVNDQVTYLGESNITAAVETDIRELITEWGTIKNDNAIFTATESNEGFNLDSNTRRTRVKKELAGLLYFTNLQFGGQNWARHARG
jgi:ATP-dependent helicase/DNAse subunit B